MSLKYPNAFEVSEWSSKTCVDDKVDTSSQDFMEVVRRGRELEKEIMLSLSQRRMRDWITLRIEKERPFLGI